jgi:pSer/pThr/pTyr-binding forkhead associated (FHA) protein
MAVSTRHAEIRLNGNDYVLVDLESVNGTRLNGKKLMSHRPRLLSNGDEIRVANFTVTFSLGVVAGSDEPRDASVRHAREMLANVLARSGMDKDTRSLVVISGPHRASRFELPSGQATLTIGRGSDMDIALSDRDVSREHAELALDADGITIRDLRSRNGLFVDGRKVASAKLAAGVRFTVGKTTMALESPAERTLGVIFEAPEEDTSSFALMADDQSVDTVDTAPLHEEDDVSESPAEMRGELVEEAPLPPEEPELPVGPVDPLVGLEEGARRQRSTFARPGLSQTDDKTDAGLIVVGAIILLASVAALVYLFT